MLLTLLALLIPDNDQDRLKLALMTLLD